MNVDATSITLTVMEIVALLAAAISFGRMSQKLDTLVKSVDGITNEVGKIVTALGNLMERVGILEDRDDRKSRRER